MFVQDTRTECWSSLIVMRAQYGGELGSTKRIEQAASWRSRGAWGCGCAQPQAPCARGAQRQRDSLAVALPPRLVRRNRQTILYSIFVYVGIVFDRKIAKS
jgi:hypothetical protein